MSSLDYFEKKAFEDLLRNTMTPPIYDYNVDSLLQELKLRVD